MIFGGVDKRFETYNFSRTLRSGHSGLSGNERTLRETKILT